MEIMQFLTTEVVPALGCTEPGAVALAVSRACDALDDRGGIQSVRVRVSDCVYKNGIDVGIPGVNGARGSVVAAALAMCCGCSRKGLESLENCSEEHVRQALAWIENGVIKVENAPEHQGVFVEATVRTRNHIASAVIVREHGTISEVSLDGELVYRNETLSAPHPSPSTPTVLEAAFADLYALAGGVDDAIEESLLSGVEMNQAICKEGLSLMSGRGGSLAGALADTVPSPDLGFRIRIECVAAAEARMRGSTLPVMSSSGSGNAGITAILPVSLVASAHALPNRVLAHGLLASHLVTSYVKQRIGRLAPVCGCVIAAGSGAAAGICRLFEADALTAGRAIRTLLANTAGLFCDGAKESCALKVGTAAHEAYLAAMLSLRGKGIDRAQGVIADTVEDTVDNLARLNEQGLAGLDRLMIEMIEQRNGRRSATNVDR
ncbi:serine dehydratase subunit alpha family protein [Candidatus Bipolaricaulota bacterium]|nr:serine dehydratase subunit alpha family protein [Candidatus Bipolaricaulota bacterium]